MQELITEDQAQVIVLIFAALITLGSLGFGLLWKSRIPKAKRKIFGIQVGVIALVGPLVAGLWFLYNAIEDHYGLDSVKALLINFALFIAVGLLISYLFSNLPARFSKTKKA
jgi:hypothetical protein